MRLGGFYGDSVSLAIIVADSPEKRQRGAIRRFSLSRDCKSAAANGEKCLVRSTIHGGHDLSTTPRLTWLEDAYVTVVVGEEKYCTMRK